MTKEKIDSIFSMYGRYAEARDYALLRAIEAIVAPQRTWAGLTPKDIADLVVYPMNPTADLVRAIEAKLKEKNT